MTPEQSRGQIFKITAKHSGKSLGIGLQAMPPKLVLRQETFSNQIKQQFLVFPLDDGTYAIASMSGTVLDIDDHSNDDRTPCIVHPFHGKDNQRFIIEDAGGEFCFLRAKHSGKVLDVKGKSKSNDALVHQFRQKQGADADNQLFKFEPVGTYQMPVMSGLGLLPPVPTPTGIEDNLPGETTPVVMGETLLPYFSVEETLPRDKQAHQTPYYRLQKLQRWTKVHQRVFSGPAQTHTHTVANGMKKTHNEEMSKTTSLSIEVGGAKYLPKLQPLKLTVGQQLVVKESTSTETSSQTTVERQVSYAGGPPVLYAEYVLLSQFSLHRSDGIAVKGRWDATNSDEMRQVAFPPAGMQSLRVTRR